jgi:uncharacterized protein YkwD
MPMSPRARVCLFLAAALLATRTTASAQRSDAAQDGQPTTRGPDLSRVEGGIVEATNDFRAEQGRRRVEVNRRLKDAAEGFAHYMAKTGRYGHEADGRTPADRVKVAGYDYCVVAENIAYFYSSAGFTTAELSDKFFAGWKNSPHHRENMLDPDVTETAVAVARSADTGYYYAVQLFGRPKSNEIAFQVANESGAEIRYTLEDRDFALPPRATRTHYACRPPELNIKRDGAGDDVYEPGNGTQYVVKAGEGNSLVVERRENVEMPPPPPAPAEKK